MNKQQIKSWGFVRSACIASMIFLLSLLSSCASNNLYRQIDEVDLTNISIEERSELLYEVIDDWISDELRLQRAKKVIDSGPIDYTMKFYNDSTLLLAAAANSDNAWGSSSVYNPIIEWMIEDGADVNYQGKKGHTALHAAAKAWRACNKMNCGYRLSESTYKLLIAHGADDSIPSKWGTTPKDWYMEMKSASNNPTPASDGIDGDTLMQALVIGADAALAEKQRQINEANMIRQQQIQYQQQHQQRLQQQTNAVNSANSSYQQTGLSPQQQYEAEMSSLRALAKTQQASNNTSNTNNNSQDCYVVLPTQFYREGETPREPVGFTYKNSYTVASYKTLYCVNKNYSSENKINIQFIKIIKQHSANSACNKGPEFGFFTSLGAALKANNTEFPAQNTGNCYPSLNEAEAILKQKISPSNNGASAQ